MLNYKSNLCYITVLTSHINTNLIRHTHLSIFVEKIVFSGKVIKYNRFGMKQDRTIMLTNLFLSNIKKKGTVINSPKIYLLKFD